MRKQFPFLCGAALLLALSLSACGSGSKTTPPSSSPESESTAGILSSFTAPDLEGNQVDESILSDHTLTMVNVWTTSCGYCIQEMPELNALAQEYADQGVQVLGLVLDVMDQDGSYNQDQLGLAQDIVANAGSDYTQLLLSEDLYHIAAQISGTPTAFFVDSTGNQVGYAYSGAMDQEQWSQILDEVLAEVQE
mgnify:CR=1 FL=1